MGPAKTLPKKSARTKEKKLPNKGIKKLMSEKLNTKKQKKLSEKIIAKINRKNKKGAPIEVVENIEELITSSEHVKRNGKDVFFMVHKDFPDAIFIESI